MTVDLVGVDLEPEADVTVTVDLVDGEQNPVQALASGQIVTYPRTVVTDEAGHAEIELPLNADLVPSPSYFLVSSFRTGGQLGRRTGPWLIDVTGDGTVEDLIVGTPAAPIAATLLVQSQTVDWVVVCTQAAYDALSPPDPLTLYVIRN